MRLIKIYSSTHEHPAHHHDLPKLANQHRQKNTVSARDDLNSDKAGCDYVDNLI